MRYHYDKPTVYSQLYGQLYICDHPVYNNSQANYVGFKN